MDIEGPPYVFCKVTQLANEKELFRSERECITSHNSCKQSCKKRSKMTNLEKSKSLQELPRHAILKVTMDT